MTITPEGAARTRACRKCQALFSGIRCKACERVKNSKYKYDPEKARAQRAKFYSLNSEKVAAYNSAWRAKNKERFDAAQKKWRRDHKEIVYARSTGRRERLSDGYVASLLGMSVERAPKELIELKRVHVKIRRLIKKSADKL